MASLSFAKVLHSCLPRSAYMNYDGAGVLFVEFVISYMLLLFYGVVR